ncbi:MAG TPA: prepilin-type N-terminal cleavage/methylation domain-containing protein [Kiritimatiellia bacterium]|nr:prepilin-type N-terminal cleavage/methylation domain-containing protein [Kiritimatiellia bacterium]HRZ13392.1 prepilin-type N-terminal cleavage/methylation domain-containing protein [Kiritimatiellia bacterium]
MTACAPWGARAPAGRAEFSNDWKNRKPSFPNIGKPGFSLVELLVVVAILFVLAAALVPWVIRSIEAGRRAQCGSNLRQLFVANAAYAAENGSYVAAAPDIMGPNRRRWHGVRSSGSGAFEGSLGPLARFLEDGRARRCPSFPDYRRDAAANAFESACGGYGYNDRGVGSRVYLLGYGSAAMQQGMFPGAIRNPARTVMFADAAFGQPYNDPRWFIEYSFAEAYYFVGRTPAQLYGPSRPSVHFRHGGRAGVVWCDGHVTWETQALGNPASGLGWFGPADNSLFDPL